MSDRSQPTISGLPLDGFDFMPTMRTVSIGWGVVYRPLRSWHSGVFAGERLTHIPGQQDRSGCIREADDGSIYRATVPLTYTHRLYWRSDDPGRYVSAFLSYPGGMGCSDHYFWEARLDDCQRFASEIGMEEEIRLYLGTVQS